MPDAMLGNGLGLFVFGMYSPPTGAIVSFIYSGLTHIGSILGE